MSRLTWLCLMMIAPIWASAEPVSYNRIDFQVEASREAPNDLLVATLYVEIQDKQPARVTQQVHAIVNDAINRAKAFKTVKVSSGAQRVSPVYGKNNQVDAWRGRSEIRLESQDFESVGELIMQLQPGMQISNVQFSPAPNTQAKFEQVLVADAIQAFQKRAEEIRSAMGASRYKTVQLNISNSVSNRPEPMMLMRATMADAAPSAPEFAAGDSRMSVRIHASIELQ